MTTFTPEPPATIDNAERTAIGLAIRGIAPFALSLIPFSLAVGSAAAATGLGPGDATGSAVFPLAGGAQLAAIELLAGGAGAAVIPHVAELAAIAAGVKPPTSTGAYADAAARAAAYWARNSESLLIGS